VVGGGHCAAYGNACSWKFYILIVFKRTQLSCLRFFFITRRFLHFEILFNLSRSVIYFKTIVCLLMKYYCSYDISTIEWFVLGYSYGGEIKFIFFFLLKRSQWDKILYTYYNATTTEKHACTANVLYRVNGDYFTTNCKYFNTQKIQTW